jgi:hypothetical protein
MRNNKGLFFKPLLLNWAHEELEKMKKFYDIEDYILYKLIRLVFFYCKTAFIEIARLLELK